VIFREELDLDLLENFSVEKLMQIHFFKLVFNCTYELIDFQDDNSKNLDV